METMREILFISIFMLGLSTVSAQNTDERPSQFKEGYYIKDGERHNVKLLSPGEDLRYKMLIVPEQNDYSEPVTFTPDMVSEYGYDNEKRRYVAARVETDTGDEWYYMTDLQTVNDSVRIVYIPGKAHPSKTDTYFRLEGDRATETGTARQPGPMWDFLSETTGFDPLERRGVALPKRLPHGTVDYYYKAYSAGSYKAFQKIRFGLTGSFVGFIPFTGIYEYDTGFSVGAFLRVPIEGGFSVQPELIYVRNIYKAKSWTFKINGMRVPLMLKYDWTQSRSNWVPYLELGPLLRYDFERDYVPKQFGFGFALGAGVEYYISGKYPVWLGTRLIVDSNRTIELVLGFSIF